MSLASAHCARVEANSDNAVEIRLPDGTTTRCGNDVSASAPRRGLTAVRDGSHSHGCARLAGDRCHEYASGMSGRALLVQEGLQLGLHTGNLYGFSSERGNHPASKLHDLLSWNWRTAAQAAAAARPSPTALAGRIPIDDFGGGSLFGGLPIQRPPDCNATMIPLITRRSSIRGTPSGLAGSNGEAAPIAHRSTRTLVAWHRTLNGNGNSQPDI